MHVAMAEATPWASLNSFLVELHKKITQSGQLAWSNFLSLNCTCITISMRLHTAVCIMLSIIVTT